MKALLVTQEPFLLACWFLLLLISRFNLESRQGHRVECRKPQEYWGFGPYWVPLSLHVFLDFSSNFPQMRSPKLSFCQTSLNPQTIFLLLSEVHHYLNTADKLQLKYTHPQNSFSLFFCISAYAGYDDKWIKLSQHNARLARAQLITDPDT